MQVSNFCLHKVVQLRDIIKYHHDSRQFKFYFSNENASLVLFCFMVVAVIMTAEVQEMEQNLPKTCQTQFDDANKLNSFWLYITPDEGFWHGGRYKFHIDVPEEYNIVVCGKTFCIYSIFCS